MILKEYINLLQAPAFALLDCKEESNKKTTFISFFNRNLQQVVLNGDKNLIVARFPIKKIEDYYNYEVISMCLSHNHYYIEGDDYTIPYIEIKEKDVKQESADRLTVFSKLSNYTTLKTLYNGGDYNEEELVDISCRHYCANRDGDCRNCKIQEAFDKLSKYEDLGLLPEQIAEKLGEIMVTASSKSQTRDKRKEKSMTVFVVAELNPNSSIKTILGVAETLEVASELVCAEIEADSVDSVYCISCTKKHLLRYQRFDKYQIFEVPYEGYKEV